MAKSEKAGGLRQVQAPSIIEGIQHLDEMSRGWFDMYLVKVEASDLRDGYVSIEVFVWENTDTRDMYKC